MGLRVHKNDIDQIACSDNHNQFYQRRASGSKLVYSLSRHLFKAEDLYHIDAQYKQFSFKSYYLEYGSATILEYGQPIGPGDIISCSDLTEMTTIHFSEDSSMIATVFNDLTSTHYHKRERMVENAMKLLDDRGRLVREHTERVLGMTSLMGVHLGFRSEKLFALNQAARFHDMGILHLPPNFLNRVTVSDPEQLPQYQQHVFLKQDKLLEGIHGTVPTIVEQHHERLDGSGYPHGLKGDEICDEAKIIAICDTFDQLVFPQDSVRRTKEDAFQLLKEQTPQLLDKNLVDTFISIIDDKFDSIMSKGDHNADQID